VRRSTIGLVLAAAVIVGCGGGGGDTDTTTDTTADTTTDDAAAANSDGTAPTADDATADDTAGSGVATTQPTVDTNGDEPGEATPAEPVRPFPWLPDLPLLTEPSDDPRPLLAWEAVDGAVVYSVTVTAPTGTPYWAWQTDATSVHLGGDPRLDDDQSGPSTLPGMTWSVLAFDADDRPVAASVEAPLRP
jgi:hypothetical protein